MTTPAGGPFTSSPFSWNEQPNTPNPYIVTGKDNLGGQSTTQLTFIQDQSGPTGGSISYPSGIVNTPSVSISTSAGSDGGSGVNLAGSVVKRDSTPLNTATDSCNGFPATFATTITLAEDPAVEAVPIEAAGGVLSAEQRAFREAWLGSKQPH